MVVWDPAHLQTRNMICPAILLLVVATLQVAPELSTQAVPLTFTGTWVQGSTSLLAGDFLLRGGMLRFPLA